MGYTRIRYTMYCKQCSMAGHDDCREAVVAGSDPSLAVLHSSSIQSDRLLPNRAPHFNSVTLPNPLVAVTLGQQVLSSRAKSLSVLWAFPYTAGIASSCLLRSLLASHTAAAKATTQSIAIFSARQVDNRSQLDHANELDFYVEVKTVGTGKPKARTDVAE